MRSVTVMVVTGGRGARVLCLIDIAGSAQSSQQTDLNILRFQTERTCMFLNVHLQVCFVHDSLIKFH